MGATGNEAGGTVKRVGASVNGAAGAEMNARWTDAGDQ